MQHTKNLKAAPVITAPSATQPGSSKDLRELPYRTRHCLEVYCGVTDKAALVEAITAGKVTRDIPNLGEKSYNAVIAYAKAAADAQSEIDDSGVGIVEANVKGGR